MKTNTTTPCAKYKISIETLYELYKNKRVHRLILNESIVMILKLYCGNREILAKASLPRKQVNILKIPTIDDNRISYKKDIKYKNI